MQGGDCTTSELTSHCTSFLPSFSFLRKRPVLWNDFTPFASELFQNLLKNLAKQAQLHETTLNTQTKDAVGGAR